MNIIIKEKLLGFVRQITKQHLFHMQHTFLYFFAIAVRQRLLSLGQTGWKIGALRYNLLYSPSLYIPTLSWYSGSPCILRSPDNFPKFLVAIYFLKSWPVYTAVYMYNGHPVYNGRLAISQVTVVHRLTILIFKSHWYRFYI